MFNIDIRNAIKNAGLFGYEVAAALRISETSFSRAISRSELTDSRKEQIFKAIEEISKDKKIAPWAATHGTKAVTWNQTK